MVYDLTIVKIIYTRSFSRFLSVCFYVYLYYYKIFKDTDLSFLILPALSTVRGVQ